MVGIWSGHQDPVDHGDGNNIWMFDRRASKDCCNRRFRRSRRSLRGVKGERLRAVPSPLGLMDTLGFLRRSGALFAQPAEMH
jgi:hypothetical protein